MLNKPDWQVIFIALWIITILCFMLSINLSNPGDVLIDFPEVLFIGNVLLGVISFVLSFVLIFKKVGKPRLASYVWLVLFAYFIFYTTTFTVNGHGLIAGQMGIGVKEEQASPTAAPTEELMPTPTNLPAELPKTTPKYIDPDPLVGCNISANCGGGTRQMKQSACSSSACCQVGTSWSMYPNKSACTQAQNNYSSSRSSGTNYPPCTVYYPALHTSSTYLYTAPATCKQWQDAASSGNTNTSLQSTVAPYQYSQEYLDSLKKFDQEVSKPYTPPQFVAPTQKCYATWDEYFNAHPNYAPQNIQGMSATPPCD